MLAGSVYESTSTGCGCVGLESPGPAALSFDTETERPWIGAVVEEPPVLRSGRPSISDERDEHCKGQDGDDGGDHLSGAE
jgi:hypothetical protein